MRLRTLHINTQHQWGGGERQTLYLVEGLARRGHEAILATRPGSPLAQRALRAGIEIFPIRPLNEVDPLVVWKLGRLLRSRRSQVLHMHTPHGHFLGILACRLARGAVRIVSRRVTRSIYGVLSLRLNWIKYRFGVDRFIAVSRAVKETLVRDGVRPAAVSVVHSGAAPPAGSGSHGDPSALATAIRGELDLPAGVPLVVSAGALVRAEGLQTLLRAAREVLRDREAGFIFVGEGPLARSLRKEARTLGIEGRVRFAGFREDPERWIAAASAFVLPSAREGLGTSLLDALLLERPVVASHVGGIPEVVEHGVHGLLVPPGDARSLASALAEVLEHPDAALERARAGRARVLRDFTIDRMVEQTLSVYAQALHDAAASAAGSRRPGRTANY